MYDPVLSFKIRMAEEDREIEARFTKKPEPAPEVVEPELSDDERYERTMALFRQAWS
jgi:hypothetical protein